MLCRMEATTKTTTVIEVNADKLKKFSNHEYVMPVTNHLNKIFKTINQDCNLVQKVIGCFRWFLGSETLC